MASFTDLLAEFDETDMLIVCSTQESKANYIRLLKYMYSIISKIYADSTRIGVESYKQKNELLSTIGNVALNLSEVYRYKIGDGFEPIVDIYLRLLASIVIDELNSIYLFKHLKAQDSFDCISKAVTALHVIAF